VGLRARHQPRDADADLAEQRARLEEARRAPAAVRMGWYDCRHSRSVAEDRYRVQMFPLDVRSGEQHLAARGLLASASPVRELLDRLYAARGR